ncbi:MULTISPECIES: peptidoglycan bridge formation glycyltransferase FemA/FemB family protein [unclassified Streptomyces]|uniref:lipid II:glycine glycyltransferase FemX n=1 Tax=unclassified Streptomyces TaxID=2593676 RepID=UPI002035CAA9|nr:MULTISPECIES: peptidoglycan bridge formation glycyltransferase FemA/FemB family protein [unclassified Streptomyces]
MAPQHQEGREGRREGHHRRIRGPDDLPRALLRDGRARWLRTPPADLLPAHVDRLGSGTPRPDAAHLAHHAGEVLSAATMLTVGTHVWYSYGGSASRRRELQPSNAVQWRMMNDAHESGAHIYDLRGITDTLEEDNPLLGLLRFKAGTGGQAAEYLGEWDFPLNRFLHRALSLYMARR